MSEEIRLEATALARHRRFVFDVARALVGDANDADDVAQETMILALREPRIDHPTRFLRTIARRVASNRWRSARRRDSRERRAAVPESVAPASTVVERVEIERSVVAAVMDLEPSLREPILLRFYEDLPPREIARRLELGVPEVHARLKRGVRRLRADLEHRRGSAWRGSLLALVHHAPPSIPVVGAATWAGVVAVAVVVVVAAAVLLAPRAPLPGPPAVSALRSDPPAPPSPAAPIDPVRAATTDDVVDRLEERVVRGRIVDPDGNPVPGAALAWEETEPADRPLVTTLIARPAVAEPSPPSAAISAADGRFVLLPSDEIGASLVIRARGFVVLRHELPSDPRVANDIGDVVLTAGVVLSGRVVDAEGRPASGVVIRVNDEAMPGSVSDADGCFECPHVERGDWTLRLSSIHAPDAVVTGRTPDAGTTARIEVALEAGAALRGVVLDLPPDRGAGFDVLAVPPGLLADGLPGALVPLARGDGGLASVGAGGRFELLGLRAERRYDLVLRVAEGRILDRTGHRSLTIEAAPGPDPVTLRYAPGASIALRLVDAAGMPISGARVVGGFSFSPLAVDPRGSVTTEHEDGRYRIDGVRSRVDREVAAVAVSAVGYKTHHIDGIRLESGAALDLGDVALTRLPVVRVHVTEAATGEPVRGASVRMELWDGREGAPTVLPGGGTSFGFARRVTDVPPFDFRSIATFGPSASPPDRAGRPRIVREGTTDDDGTWIENALPGQWVRFECDDPRFLPLAPDPVALPVGGDFDVGLVLRAGASVVVTVLDGDGAPVADRSVEHVAEYPGEESTSLSGVWGDVAQTNEDGRVVFSRLALGRHRFRVVGNEGVRAVASGSEPAHVLRSPAWSVLRVAEGVDGAVVLRDGPRAGLSGVVTERGTPLSNAHVALYPDDSPPARFTAMMGAGITSRTDGAGRFSSKTWHRVRIASWSRTAVSTCPTTPRVRFVRDETGSRSTSRSHSCAHASWTPTASRSQERASACASPESPPA